MAFEWDERKAASNLQKHDVSFDEAIQAFDDPCRVEEFDVMSAEYREDRTKLIGFSERRLLTVSFTNRGDRIRIISARKASKKEHDHYQSENPQI
jgi:hypothetical protein